MFQRNIPSKNDVQVMVWPSSDIKSFGHVALRTFCGGNDGKGYYVSFWPGSEEQPCCCEPCSKTYNHFHSKEEDVEYCGQAHIDNTFTLKTLSINAINGEYERRREIGLRWTLKSSLLNNGDDKIANCCSLVNDLLCAGGLDYYLLNEDRVTSGLGSPLEYACKIGAIVGIPVALYLLYAYNKSIVTTSQGPLMEGFGGLPTGYVLNANQLGTVPIKPIYSTAADISYFGASVCQDIVQYGYKKTTLIYATTASFISGLFFRTADKMVNAYFVKPSDFLRLMPSVEIREAEMKYHAKVRLHLHLIDVDAAINKYQIKSSDLHRSGFFAASLPCKLWHIKVVMKLVKERACTLSEGLESIIHHANAAPAILSSASKCLDLIRAGQVKADKRFPLSLTSRR